MAKPKPLLTWKLLGKGPLSEWQADSAVPVAVGSALFHVWRIAVTEDGLFSVDDSTSFPSGKRMPAPFPMFYQAKEWCEYQEAKLREQTK
jgi:hypothetical protein